MTTDRLDIFLRSGIAAAVSYEGTATSRDRFDTLIEFSAARVLPSVNAVWVAGRNQVDDGKPGLYVRVDEEPTHSAKVQTADGGWWSLVFEPGTPVDVLGDLSAAAQTPINLMIAQTQLANVPAGSYPLSGPVNLNNGQMLIGSGPSRSILRTPSNDYSLRMESLTDTKGFFDTVAHLRLDRNAAGFSASNGGTIYARDLGYPLLFNVDAWGGPSLPIYDAPQGVVGQRTIHSMFRQGAIGEKFVNPDTLLGNTASFHVGLVRDIMPIVIQNTGLYRHMATIGGVWQNFAKLFDQTDDEQFTNFTSAFSWWEGFHPQRVQIVGNNLSVDTSLSGQIVSDNGLLAPLILADYFSGSVQWSGAYYPQFHNIHVTPAGPEAEFFIENTATDGQFDVDMLKTNRFGAGSRVRGVSGNLPKHGKWSTLDVEHRRQGVSHSEGADNRAGIYDGCSSGYKNLIDFDVTQTAFPGAGLVYWPDAAGFFDDYGDGVTKAAPVAGQADPWGGTSAVRIENALHASFDVPDLAGGGMWLTMIAIVRGLADNATWAMGYKNNGGSQDQDIIKRRLPDQDWRVMQFSAPIAANAGAAFRLINGAEASSIAIARCAAYVSPNLYPPIEYGRDLTGQPFDYLWGRVAIEADALPSAGRWFVGDRVRRRTPTVGQWLRQVCTTSGDFAGTAPQFTVEATL
ncbi:MAG: hypothetical protein AAGI03_00775 [Pseudomonadota bacterium]